MTAVDFPSTGCGHEIRDVNWPYVSQPLLFNVLASVQQIRQGRVNGYLGGKRLAVALRRVRQSGIDLPHLVPLGLDTGTISRFLR